MSRTSRTIVKHPALSKRTMSAYIVDAMGGGLCKTHGGYYGHGEHGLRDCPYCDIDEFYKKSKAKGKGNFEQKDPNCIVKGKPVARKHHEAAERAKAMEANNTPMTRGHQKINWNLNVHDGAIVQMSPEEYMERVNIFNRYPLGEVIRQEMKAQERGYRGIGYYPPLSEHSYKSILEGIKAGNEMDIPNLIYKDGWMQNQEGFHRALVATDLGLKQIPVHVIGRMPKKFIKADKHRNINMVEQVEAINSLKEKYLASEK